MGLFIFDLFNDVKLAYFSAQKMEAIRSPKRRSATKFLTQNTVFFVGASMRTKISPLKSVQQNPVISGAERGGTSEFLDTPSENNEALYVRRVVLLKG
jgi:hypothetical protein